ncbi:mitochondrial copper chaperone for cytochrome c oxidase Cox19 [Schizosaccharomyces osmophilus]|uniref:Mitochondrial copper chaperone for cytochrome c oxidase Cox19 n=1 Tax=Schizosaccharomyces osmophilus TaxID=2545709 RepID=A0AAF0AYS6_9SCHI|nr:mitochondrial copper chaperone for cytochrome c oxidase Cox19 [Schizosaccharomyces osmophilus]WBW75260.1 mitochondrial copper chaperone for cytochrome c oxidase Cox19 [Schizosaccharomyces osmophilus]
MSFGAAGGSMPMTSKEPPERGSFPLDHFGECTIVMKEYLECIKTNRSRQQECRPLAKKYLQCRMDAGLFGQDDMSNLGFEDEGAEKSDSKKE